MPTDQVLAFIAHHGVKGQKWGVRTKRSSSSSSKNGVAHLSNEQLKTAIDRMNLEKQYKTLNSGDNRAGTSYSRDLLKNSGKTVVGIAVSTAATVAVKSALASVTKKTAQQTAKTAALAGLKNLS